MRLLYALALVLASLVLSGCLGNSGTSPAPTNNTSASANLSSAPAVISLQDRTFSIFSAPECSGPACDAIVQRTTAYMVGQKQVADELGKTTITLRDCLSLTNASKPTCIYMAAKQLNDSNACAYGHLVDETTANGCFHGYAVYASQPAACDQINTSSSSSVGDFNLILRAQCHLDLGVITADPALCRKGGQEMAQALGPYASGSDTSSIPTEDWCMREAGIQRRDSSLCSDLNSDDKAWCEYRIAHPVPRPAYCNEDISLGISHAPQGKAIRAIAQMDDGATLLSWWDYGYGVDCAGLRTVISTNHSDPVLTTQVAYLYTNGNASELADFMRAHGAKYVMFDLELLGRSEDDVLDFGMKYPALNYLSCVWQNKTDSQRTSSQSECEADNQPEEIWVPLGSDARNCSSPAGDSGYKAYQLHAYQNEYGFFQSKPDSKPAYCVVEENPSSFSVYLLNPNGSTSARSPLAWMPQSYASPPPIYPSGVAFAAVYDNKTLSSASSPIYRSNLYRALVLKHLDGFDLVYSSDEGERVVVFKLK